MALCWISSKNSFCWPSFSLRKATMRKGLVVIIVLPTLKLGFFYFITRRRWRLDPSNIVLNTHERGKVLHGAESLWRAIERRGCSSVINCRICSAKAHGVFQLTWVTCWGILCSIILQKAGSIHFLSLSLCLLTAASPPHPTLLFTFFFSFALFCSIKILKERLRSRSPNATA